MGTVPTEMARMATSLAELRQRVHDLESEISSLHEASPAQNKLKRHSRNNKSSEHTSASCSSTWAPSRRSNSLRLSLSSTASVRSISAQRRLTQLLPR